MIGEIDISLMLPSLLIVGFLIEHKPLGSPYSR
jgi:hypothetical protein